MGGGERREGGRKKKDVMCDFFRMNLCLLVGIGGGGGRCVVQWNSESEIA